MSVFVCCFFLFDNVISLEVMHTSRVVLKLLGVKAGSWGSTKWGTCMYNEETITICCIEHPLLALCVL